MAIDISLVAVPKEAFFILEKAAMHPDSEYCDAVFGFDRALQNTLTDFGHPDWIAFKKDAQDLLQHYPNGKFDARFYVDTERTYEVFDYLFAKKEDSVRHFKDSDPFFYDGIQHPSCTSGQGFKLIYWDATILRNKKVLFDSVSFENLSKLYDYENMVGEAVYKIEQLHGNTEKLQRMHADIQLFLENALKLNGYVLVMKS